MIFRSIYLTKTIRAILDIVDDQPDPSVFYKSYLELGGSNMVSILSFDSRSILYLLDDKYERFFLKDYPLFYKNKFKKSNFQGEAESPEQFFYRSSIDSALKNNQVGSIRFIINYIVKHQNSFVSHSLFLNNFHAIIDHGIDVKPLLDSQVLNYTFIFEEWPNTHSNEKECFRPYNEVLYQIRDHYRVVFPEEEFAPDDYEVVGKVKTI